MAFLLLHFHLMPYDQYNGLRLVINIQNAVFFINNRATSSYWKKTRRLRRQKPPRKSN